MKSRWPFLLVLPLALWLCWIGAGAGRVGWFSDSVDYLRLAEVIRHGGGADGSTLATLQASRFPPGFPALLALVGASTAAASVAHELTVLLAFLAALAIVTWLVREVADLRAAALLSAAAVYLPLRLLLVIAVGKILTTAFSIGSGGSGGVFGPSMVIGGTLGGAVGLMAQQLMPGVVTQPGAFVAVGMAGFFSAAANTPISTLVMVSEMTGNYQLLLPALWVCALSYLLARRWKLYRSQVASRLDSPAHRGAILGGILKAIRVADVLGNRPTHSLPETASLREVVQACMSSSQHTFPVLDAGGRMTGLITLGQVRQFLDEMEDGTPVIAHDLASRPRATLAPHDDLDTALQRVMALELEELPVVDPADSGKVLGILSRRDIIAAYARRRLDSGPEPELGH